MNEKTSILLEKVVQENNYLGRYELNHEVLKNILIAQANAISQLHNRVRQLESRIGVNNKNGD